MKEIENKLPDLLIACIGGGSNALGLFHEFLDDPEVKMLAVEAAGLGLSSGKHAASLSGGRPGVLHGNKTYLLQSKSGQIEEAHSISAGLDYPGISPLHCFLKDTKRAKYSSASDEEALEAYQLVSRLENISPSLEPSHAFAKAIKIAPKLKPSNIIIVNSCGDSIKDKDIIKSKLGSYIR